MHKIDFQPKSCYDSHYTNEYSCDGRSHTHTHTYSTFDLPIFTKVYELYKLLTSAVTSFPKTKRYTLGQKLDNITLDIFELLFSLFLTEDKIVFLKKISVKVDLLKVLLRLAKDTQALTNKSYLELQTIVQDIGKMLGGWIRSTKRY